MRVELLAPDLHDVKGSDLAAHVRHGQLEGVVVADAEGIDQTLSAH